VVRGDARVLSLISEADRAGKKIDGHSAGAAGRKLQAYASLGITSCHEPTTAAEVLERLRLGIYVLVREGEVRRELEEVARIKDTGIDFRLLALGSDGPGPWQLRDSGYMEYVVQKAIDLGFNPVTVYQMASLNAAQRFGLADKTGGIAPGKYADMVVVPDLKTVRPEYVVSRGRQVAEHGRLTAEPRNHKFPAWFWNTVNWPNPLTAEDFRVSAAGEAPIARVRVLDLVSALVSREAIVELPVNGRQVRPDPAAGVIKVAAIERTHRPGRMFTGFVRGLGLRRGAVAISTMWDTADVGVAGADEADMALAVNRIKELGGGLVVCAGGEILAELALPMAGLFSPEPLEKIVDKLDDVQQAAAGLGCVFPDIRLTLSVLSGAAIPFLRICESGLFDLQRDRPVDLLVD
jgi:adenine deaminase